LIHFEIRKKLVQDGLLRELLETFDTANLKDYLLEIEKIKVTNLEELQVVTITNLGDDF